MRLSGSLNQKTAYKLNDSLIPIILKYGIKNMVYNFNELDNLDEVGFNTLLSGYNAILHNNGKVLAVNNKFNLNFINIETELGALDKLKV